MLSVEEVWENHSTVKCIFQPIHFP